MDSHGRRRIAVVSTGGTIANTPDGRLSIDDVVDTIEVRHPEVAIRDRFDLVVEEVEREAVRKLREKKLDLMVANDVSAADAGFEVDGNRVTVMAPDAEAERWPLSTKADVAVRLVQRIEDIARRRSCLLK
jgi:phosphopantothenoylcysteine synthetase/decarboxylase